MENLNKLDKINKELSDDVKAIDLALELSEYEDEEIEKLCESLDDEHLARILEESEPKTQITILKFIENERVMKVFGYMSKDDIVDILGIVNTGRKKELINIMKEGDRKIVKELLGYKDDSAGGIMTTEYITISQKLTITDAIKKIKEITPKTEYIETLYVIDDKKKTIGTVELRDLLIADENATMDKIVNTNFVYVEPETDQEEVAFIVSKYDLNAIPVLNKRKRMLGIITIDDIVDVMVEEQTEDILKMGGVAKEEGVDTTLLESIRLRLPWLFINLITAFLASLTVKAFESTIAQVVALSATMSIVTGMGGNAGTQTVSIIIRNIATKKIKIEDAWHLLKKEVLLGLIDGASIGFVTGIIVGLIYGNMYLGLIIFLAMIGNIIISGFFGLLIPLLLDKMKMDPALSSSIFLTTATDVLGFFIFLSLASLFLPKLM